MRASKTEDRLDSVLGELDTVRKSVKKVEQSFETENFFKNCR